MTACTPRMLSVLQDLSRHTAGIPTPELAERHVTGLRTRDSAVSKCGQMMRNLEHHGLARRAGTVRGAVIWQATDLGKAAAAGVVPGRPRGRRTSGHAAEAEQRNIRLGAAGWVSVTVSARQPGAAPAEKLARLRRLIGEIEALAS